MKRWKRLLYYLSINVLVSACTILAILVIWDRVRQPEIDDGTLLSQSQSSTTLTSEEASEMGVGGEPGNPQLVPGALLPTSTPKATAVPTRSTRVYTVESGDTLGEISRKFEIEIEELIAANDLPNPDVLEVGQELIIPGGSALLPTVTPLPVEPQTSENTESLEEPTATFAQVTGNPEVEIESVVGAGDLSSERVMIRRTGSGDLSLAGWQIVEDGGKVFVFPQLNLYEGGAVTLYTRSGKSTVVELFWGLDAYLWESGETVILLDNTGEVRSTYRVP
jgi:LysM repeat protein